MLPLIQEKYFLYNQREISQENKQKLSMYMLPYESLPLAFDTSIRASQDCQYGTPIAYIAMTEDLKAATLKVVHRDMAKK